MATPPSATPATPRVTSSICLATVSTAYTSASIPIRAASRRTSSTSKPL